MTPSADIIAFIKGFEKCDRAIGAGMFAAYLPTPNDKPTIGWGSTGIDITIGMAPWTQAQCDERFDEDLTLFSRSVDGALTGPTTQDQFDAMVSLAYNIGVHGFLSSTVLRDHNAQNFAGAADNFVDWDEQNHTVLNGLKTRRLSEADIYRGNQSPEAA